MFMRLSWPTLSVLILVAITMLGSAARTNDDKSIARHIHEAIDAGRFAEAEAWLREHIDDHDAPVVGTYARQLEVLRRIRLDYDLTEQQLLERLQRRIPDATIEDVRRWQKSGDLQHRIIDGKTWYFGRAVGNLIRFCDEAKRREKKDVARAGWDFDLAAHTAMLLKKADDSAGPQVHPVRHRIRYTVTIDEGHPRLKAGAILRCWLPFPRDYRQQGDVKLIKSEPTGATIAPKEHPQRTIYFEQKLKDVETPSRFMAEFEFVTHAYVPDLDPAQVRAYQTDDALYCEFTAERPPHIVFSERVRSLAAEFVAAEPNPLKRARRIFRWVSENVPWCAEMEYSTIPSLSAKGLAAGRGDCGVQSLVFITLCRAAGIPARWQSGWQTLPGDWNMHDWSEFYVEPWGWLPADASYGIQEHEDVAVQEFYCGHLDAYRMIVNLDYARELEPPKTSFRSEPNDFQRGEVEIDGHNLYFDEWDWDFELKTTPLDGGMESLAEALDAVVPAALNAGKIPGAVVMVGRIEGPNHEQWHKAYGYFRTEPNPETMRADAIFDMASVTKPVAAGSSIMRLVETGKLSIDTPVAQILPEFDTDAKRAVTLRHLMTHTSGMPPYIGAKGQAEIRAEAGYPCPEALRQRVRELGLIHKPGERVTYSCLNAILCAEIVEAISGMPLDRFAREHVFDPLGMGTTGFNPPAQFRSRIVPTTRADRGTGPGGFLQGQVHDPLAAMQAGVSGNAGLFSTAADLSRIARMMLRNGQLDGVRVYTPETIAEMTNVQNPGVKNARGVEDRRGLLWDLYLPDPGDTGVDSLRAFGHTGYTGTAMRMYPDHGVYVIALTNRVHPDDSGKVGAFRQAVWQSVADVLMREAMK